VHIQITGKDCSIDFEAGPEDRILHAGLKAGFPLPYECASGTCGACRASLVSGEVRELWAQAPGRRFLKSGSTDILMCQSAPTADCSLRVRVPLAREGVDPFTPSERSATIGAAKSLTDDVLWFQVPLASPWRFKAGQFMLVGAPGLSGGRAYSMTNYAEPTRSLEFVMKRKPGGGFSALAFGERFVGTRLTLFGPLGNAIFEPGLARNLLVIAGGTGIAGMMAILAHAGDAGHFTRHRADVFFGVRTGRDVFFLDELGSLVERFPDSVAVTVALSDEPPTAVLRARYPRLHFEQGYVHDVARSGMAGRYADTRAFLAGPPVAVEAALKVLVLEARLPVTEIRYDKFG
jgi:toluene monooxygenase electron transfer component